MTEVYTVSNQVCWKETAVGMFNAAVSNSIYIYISPCCSGSQFCLHIGVIRELQKNDFNVSTCNTLEKVTPIFEACLTTYVSCDLNPDT